MNNKYIFFFSQSNLQVKEEDMKFIGIRGRRIVELAKLKLPIAPGFILDSRIVMKINKVNLKQVLKPYIERIELETKKKFGEPANPLLLKVLLSSNLNLAMLPSIHHVGLNDETVKGFAKFTGEQFAYGEYLFLYESVGKHLYRLQPEIFDKIRGEKKSPKDILPLFQDIMENKLPQNAYDQLISIIRKAASEYVEPDLEEENNPAIIIQAMVYGNYGIKSYAGFYYTRDIITGEKKLQGKYVRNAFDIGFVPQEEEKDISSISKNYYEEFKNIADTLEKYFKDIRKIKFIIENGKLWIIEQFPVENKSTRAYIKLLLDLNEEGTVSDDEVVMAIPPAQLSELLHSVVAMDSISDFPVIEGGIAGSPGACVGRVFFSTERLIEEYHRALKRGEDTNLILCLPATFADDVKAIELGQGVITVEGGYASHAPVVARSLGKVSIVHPDIKILDRSFQIGDIVVKEGDYITMVVPFYGSPKIYVGKGKLIPQNPEENGLLEFLKKVNMFIDGFDVRANADSKKDAHLSRKFTAVGVGLCRTEHMFFEKGRIEIFREMIFARNSDERRKALDKLLPIQRADFYEIFKEMAGYPVTIRLLDAPLHEFIPKTDEAMKEFIEYIKDKIEGITEEEILSRIEQIKEFNPMLGHRGCRIAVSYPEIYEMQVRAIFEAACMVRKEGIEVYPEIMIPIVMNKKEVRHIRYGKKAIGIDIKGIEDVYKEVVREYGISDLHYKVGTMIELPSACVLSDEIAEYAEFFSYGTNDLTQTTYGISRDDISSFLPDYTKYDLFTDNPFKVLGEAVKELIEISVKKGKMVRPDISLGLCGEHGAEPKNIEFCKKVGLNYVSTSPYSIPIAKLSIAQLNIKEKQKEGKDVGK